VLVSAGNGTALDVSQLRCTFIIEKTMDMQLNYSEVAIYNLAPKTETTIIRQGNRCIVEAGYEGEQYGVIFNGSVYQPIREKEDGVTYKLRLRSLDGDGFMNVNFISASLRGNVTPREVVDQCVSKVSTPAELGSISSGLSSKGLARGRVLFGQPKEYLRQLAKSEKAQFYMDDGKVNIIKAADTSKETISLTPTSGLIGAPTQTENGVQAVSLLNPRIKINSLVHIDSRYVQASQVQVDQLQSPLDVNGLYRVISLTHRGDTRGNDWYTEINAVSQVAGIPALMQDGNINPW